jgi:3-deoxy-D-manno-octulosonate 8-phosphate phosphatase (KDO 8-P phosphatase)
MISNTVIAPEVLAKAAKVKLVIFDVDGVMTDGSLFLGDDGLEYKAFNSLDGLGLKMLQRSGVEIGIITGRQSKVVKYRMDSLGIKHVYQGQTEKFPAYEKLIKELGLSMEETAYVGDDVVDLPIMQKAGLSITVQDGHPYILQYSHWQTPSVGGRGAAREVCELIMKAQNTLNTQFEAYLI